MCTGPRRHVFRFIRPHNVILSDLSDYFVIGLLQLLTLPGIFMCMLYIDVQ